MHYTVSILVNEEDDTLEGAVEQGREDIARYARRGSVTVHNVDEGTSCEVDADGSVTPDTAGEQVCVLLISHKHGQDVEVHRSQDGALNALADYVDTYWDSNGPGRDGVTKPDDRSAKIDSYFEYCESEWYEATVSTILI